MLTATFKYNDMRDKFVQFIARNDPSFVSHSNRNVLETCNRDYWSNASWSGTNSAGMLKYIQEGFTVPGLNGIDTSVIPVVKKKRIRYNDCEGDFRYDLFTVGDENHYVDWTKRESIPGITVEFATGFRGGVSATVISDYSRWILQALITLETAGVDSEIFATCKGDRRFSNSSEKLEWRLNVKQMGERCDFTNWSPLFAPGSYRVLGFFTNTLAANALGLNANKNMGGSLSDGWNVIWNDTDRKIVISHEAFSDYSFPEAKMTKELTTALASARGN